MHPVIQGIVSALGSLVPFLLGRKGKTPTVRKDFESLKKEVAAQKEKLDNARNRS